MEARFRQEGRKKTDAEEEGGRSIRLGQNQTGDEEWWRITAEVKTKADGRKGRVWA